MKILWWLVGLPLSVALTILAVANRTPVMVSFYPFHDDVSAPLFLILFVFFGLGVIVGSLVTWSSGALRRRTKRKREQAAEAPPPTAGPDAAKPFA